MAKRHDRLCVGIQRPTAGECETFLSEHSLTPLCGRPRFDKQAPGGGSDPGRGQRHGPGRFTPEGRARGGVRRGGILERCQRGVDGGGGVAVTEVVRGEPVGNPFRARIRVMDRRRGGAVGAVGADGGVGMEVGGGRRPPVAQWLKSAYRFITVTAQLSGPRPAGTPPPQPTRLHTWWMEK